MLVLELEPRQALVQTPEPALVRPPAQSPQLEPPHTMCRLPGGRGMHLALWLQL
jgi:hypothetical protein